jgi:PAS domain S-box-containing protein
LLFFSAAVADEKIAENKQHDVTIKLHWQHQFQFAGIYAAKELGFYDEAGIHVEIETGFTHPYDEVENGEVEFGLSGTGIVVEYLKGRPLVALGATFQNSPYVWLVRDDSGIYSADDFAGKTLTRQSYADDLAAIFLKQDIDISKIHFTAPEASDVEDLIAGRVDALTAYISNEPFQMAQRGVPYRTIAPQDYGINFYSDILFTSRQYLEQHPDVVKAFREATYRGWRYAADNTEAMVDLILDKYNTQNKSRAHLRYEAEQLLKLSLYPTVEFGHMTRSRWHKIARTYRDMGLYDEVSGLDEFLYHERVRQSRLFQWLALALGLLALLGLFSYLLKKQHNKLLTEQIRDRTTKLEQELQNRKSLEIAARHEGQRLQTLLDNTIDSVITINQAGEIEHYNKACISLFGYEPKEVIGQNITMLMPASYRDLHKLGMARFMSTEESRILGKAVEVEALHKNGKTIPIELTISDFKWEGQHLFTGIARDISRKKAEQHALVEAKQEAERANNAKSEFLSAMSHELRTPLNGILGFAQLLLSDKQEPLSARQEKNIKQIMHSGEHLLTLINDVLELSKIESGNIRTSSDHVQINTVIEDCLPLLQTLADQHQVKIEKPEKAVGVVLADFTKLKQVFINLVSNAIKYNQPGGKVLISTSIQTHNSMLKLTVTDTGPGIPQDKQHSVFTAFERLGQEHSANEGSGVGLSICKRLIDAMGGRIDFASSEGQGSSFWVELPLSNQQEADRQAQSDSQPESHYDELLLRRNDNHSKSMRHVLYIEDNPANIRLLEVFFSRHQRVCLHTCESAEAGLALLKTMTPHVILMDINLPGMSGIEMARLLHEDSELNKIPLIAVTAAAMQENRDAAEGLFRAYITKPIDFQLLSRTLQPLL